MTQPFNEGVTDGKGDEECWRTDVNFLNTLKTIANTLK